jgi:hypothetical protein
MFQPRFAPVTTASVRRRLKIDAVDTWLSVLITSIDTMCFIGFHEARSANHKAAA